MRATKIVAVDLVLPRPYSVRDRLRAALLRSLFKAVDRFVFYCHYLPDLGRIYRIPGDKFSYIPFKVNALSELLSIPPRDDGYLLCCGRTYRDFATFARAMTGLEYKAYILTQPKELAANGSNLPAHGLPGNVTVIEHDGSHSSWLDWIAGARAVVLPILPGVLNPAGISTYLVAMALGKCVIISAGPGTRDLLNEGQAVLVEPGDADQLRAAIVKVCEDSGFRSAVAARGRRYALALGDESRLAKDVRQLVLGQVLALGAEFGADP